MIQKKFFHVFLKNQEKNITILGEIDYRSRILFRKIEFISTNLHHYQFL